MGLPDQYNISYRFADFARSATKEYTRMAFMTLALQTVFLVIGLKASVPLPASQPTVSKSLGPRIETYVAPYVRTNNFSGVIFVAKGSQVQFRKGYGHAVREFDVPVTPETKFHIASMSKTFTAAAIMLLEQQGKLLTSDPLTKYIPDYPTGDRITLHHLLVHTSGIPNVNSFPDYVAKSRFPHRLDEIISWFRDKPLDFEPGARYSYSNSNYNVLAFVIEKVSGRPYGEFLEENIFKPLGMKDTAHHGDPEAVILLLAGGYQPAGGNGVERAPYLDWTIKTGNGSLYTTADDLYKWDRALYGDKVLNAASRRKIFTEHVEGVGYGWFIRKGKHRSVAFGGRSPGFSASIERFIDDDVCVIVLSNLYSSIAQTMAGDLAAIAFGEDRKPLIPAAPLTIGTAVLDGYLGRYQFGKDFAPNPGIVAEIKRDGSWLVLVAGGGGGASYLIPVAENRFIDRAYGGIVSFFKDAEGRTTELIWNFGEDYRAARVQ
jgi:CubicO group peptidase (beta-lactamase class C family)